MSDKATASNPVADAFWAEQDAQPFWTVPIAHGGSMPWLKVHERGLLIAMERAHRLGKTVLLVDNSDDQICDTYFSYQASLVLEAKKMVLDVAMKRKTTDEVLEECRGHLVNAMRYGQSFYIRLTDSACDFCGQFNSDTEFPLSVFDREVVAGLYEYREGSGLNMWESGHSLARALRESDLSQGLFQPRFGHKARADDGSVTGFEVILCTTFASDEFATHLASSLPMDKLQPIKPLPSSVRIKYNHYANVFELEVGGTLRWQTIDDQYALSFVFKGDFKVTLVEMASPQSNTHGGVRGWANGRGGRSCSGVAGSASAVAAAAVSAQAEAPSGISPDKEGVFRGLRGGMVYQVVIEEDEAAEEAARRGDSTRGTHRLSAAALAKTQQAAAKLATKPKGAAPVPGRSDDGSTQTSALLAAELRNLSADDIKDNSARYRALREASDLQDVVFGGAFGGERLGDD